MDVLMQTLAPANDITIQSYYPDDDTSNLVWKDRHSSSSRQSRLEIQIQIPFPTLDFNKE